jgi:TrmH family RNA methyltransferase
METSDLRICLVRPRHPGNVGSVARAMKNFGFQRLDLVSDRDPRLSREASWLAHGAEDVLDQAHLHASLEAALDSVDLVIGTTSRWGHRWRESLEPEEMADLLAAGWDGRPVSVLFGPEDRGLSVENFSRCQWVVRLPTRPECPSMNLSHAVAVFCYALGRRMARDPSGARRPACSPEEIRAFLLESERFLEKIGFSPDDGLLGRNTLIRLRRFLIRAHPERAELRLLWKLIRHLEWRLRPEGPTPPGGTGS